MASPYPIAFRNKMVTMMANRPAWQTVEEFAVEHGVHYTSLYKWARAKVSKTVVQTTCTSSAKQAVSQRLTVVERLMSEHMASYKSLHEEQCKLVSAISVLS